MCYFYLLYKLGLFHSLDYQLQKCLPVKSQSPFHAVRYALAISSFQYTGIILLDTKHVFETLAMCRLTDFGREPGTLLHIVVIETCSSTSTVSTFSDIESQNVAFDELTISFDTHNSAMGRRVAGSSKHFDMDLKIVAIFQLIEQNV